MRANSNLCQPQFVPCGLVDFLAIMVGEGGYAIGSQTFWTLKLLGVLVRGAIVTGATPMVW